MVVLGEGAVSYRRGTPVRIHREGSYAPAALWRTESPNTVSNCELPNRVSNQLSCGQVRVKREGRDAHPALGRDGTGRDGPRRGRSRGRADARDPQWTQTRGKPLQITTQLDHTTNCKGFV